MANVADRIEAEIDATVEEMVAEILASEPVLAGDGALLADVRASCVANVRRYLTVARSVEHPPPADAPLEALDVARTFVRRGIDTGVMYQAYRRGQQVLWRRWMTTAEEIATPAQLAEVLNPSLELLFTYVDDVLGRVVAEMQHEREQVLGGGLARRAETIRALLDGAPVDASTAGTRLGYDLGRQHTALVLWTETETETGSEARSQSGVTQDVLETAAVAAAAAVGPGAGAGAGTQRPLMLAAGDTVLWAWIASDAPLTAPPPAAPPGVRIAVGPTRRGRTGFRTSHRAALAVHRLMAGRPDGPPVATYAELEVVALAAHDEARAREFVVATLGPLAAEGAAAARLRETLRVFLEEAEHAPRTAARLHTHRNTVLQRIARATELLGYAPGRRRLAVELALELHRRLGPV